MRQYYVHESPPSDPDDFFPLPDNLDIYKIVYTNEFSFVDHIYTYNSLVKYIEEHATTSNFFDKDTEHDCGFSEISYFMNMGVIKTFSINKSQFIVNREVSIK